MESDFQPSRVDTIQFYGNRELFVLRDDLIHPFISGNKWRKLKYTIALLEANKKNCIVTFGGAFSNHLVATAAAGKKFNIKTVGIVRGEEVENERLGFMKKNGMTLHFVSRSDYRRKNEVEFQEELRNELISKNYIKDTDRPEFIPEGGTNVTAVKGTEEIADDIPKDITWIFCAVGTGGTVAGISRKLLNHQRIKAIPVLKNASFLEKEIQNLGGDLLKIDFLYDYHFGGYAKTNSILNNFCKAFTNSYNMPIEPVYTGKVFYAVNDLLEKGFIPEKEKILVVHTGGTPLINKIID
jgi:1-aminocyclopropane-1-carboxylate deaminase